MRWNLTTLAIIFTAAIVRTEDGDCELETDLAPALSVDLEFFNRLPWAGRVDERYAASGMILGVALVRPAPLQVNSALATACPDPEGAGIRTNTEFEASDFAIHIARFDNKFRRPALLTDSGIDPGYSMLNLTIHFSSARHSVYKWRTLPWGYSELRTRTAAEARWTAGIGSGGFTAFGRFMLNHLLQKAFPAPPAASRHSPLLFTNLARIAIDAATKPPTYV